MVKLKSTSAGKGGAGYGDKFYKAVKGVVEVPEEVALELIASHGFVGINDMEESDPGPGDTKDIPLGDTKTPEDLPLIPPAPEDAPAATGPAV
jgi:hypothetical protein